MNHKKESYANFQDTEDLPFLKNSTRFIHQETLVDDREVTIAGYVFLFLGITFIPATMGSVMANGGVVEWALAWLFSTFILSSIFRIITLVTNSSVIFENYDIE